MRTRRRDGAAGEGSREALLDAVTRDPDWAVPPAGARRSWFAAPSGALAVTSMGHPRRERVVLVPGLTGSKEDFARLMPLLAAAGYRVQAFDLAGQYESWRAGPGPGGRYDHELFAADLEAFLLDGGPAHVLGYSFAGTVAALVTARRPELVRSLALLGAPPGGGDVFARMRVLGPASRAVPGRAGATLLVWGIRSNVNGMPPGRARFVRSRFALTSRRSVVEAVGAMRHSPDPAAAVRATGVPVLLAVGRRDVWPLRHHRRAAERLGARLAVYPTGHGPCESTPHQLARDLLLLYRAADGGV